MEKNTRITKRQVKTALGPLRNNLGFTQGNFLKFNANTNALAAKPTPAPQTYGPVPQEIAALWNKPKSTNKPLDPSAPAFFPAAAAAQRKTRRNRRHRKSSRKNMRKN